MLLYVAFAPPQIGLDEALSFSKTPEWVGEYLHVSDFTCIYAVSRNVGNFPVQVFSLSLHEYSVALVTEDMAAACLVWIQDDTTTGRTHLLVIHPGYDA